MPDTVHVSRLVVLPSGRSGRIFLGQPACRQDNGMARYDLAPGIYEVWCGDQVIQSLHLLNPHVMLTVEDKDKVDCYFPWADTPIWEVARRADGA